jgi:hypothetical protein
MFVPPSTKYSPKNIHNRYPAWQIGNEIRMFSPKKLVTPFPGKYEFRSFIGEGPKYTFREVFDNNEGLKPEKRHAKANKKVPVPGPGSYNIPDKSGGPSYTMGIRYRKLNARLSKVPGVGAYNIRKDSSLNVPSCRFDREKRNNENLNKTALNNPGPGAYNINSDLLSTSGPGFSFSKSSRSFSLNDKSQSRNSSPVPGPGHYNHQHYTGYEGMKLSFTKEKREQVEYSKTPAVGQYIESIRYNPSSASYTMPKSDRKMFASQSAANVLGNIIIKIINLYRTYHI